MLEMKKILVPVDFSDNSGKILEAAVFFAQKCAAELVVVFVVQSIDDYSGFFVPQMPIVKFEEEMMESARRRMTEFAEERIGENYPYVTCVLIGDVAEEIISYADKGDIDMIIMGTHGYKGIEKVLFGSVAERVIKMAPCPVLVINPYKQQERLAAAGKKVEEAEAESA